MMTRLGNDAVHELIQLATLLKQSNAIADQIARLIGRPAEIGHLGEFIASKIFNIALLDSASHKSIDGHFVDGTLAGKSVNIKWFAKWDGLLNITPEALPDYYLILAGPKTPAMSSRGTTRPKVIEYVFLFNAAELVAALAGRVKLGVATSVLRPLWLEAEIYPNQRNTTLVLSEEQRKLLALFRQ